MKIGTEDKGGEQKTIINMVTINPTLSVITLNICGIAALFIVAKTWKQPRLPSIGD